ncbi:hypothetical protein GCM10009679_34300 [Saccharothrix algeriensis]|uniref:Low molecular weight protein antigen 6 PH domain-containing protein n=1 Tax=Catellatospora bangladeshensis TaxID=310355 RepID=A0A8J3JTM5_9ACTN|nr:hypothetical protein Cba03nite_49030 [Catellatospora bangladeshensis]
MHDVAVRRRWRRPYSLDNGLGIVASWLFVLGTGSLFCLIDLLAGGRRFGVYAVCWLLTGAVVRAGLVGLFVSDGAVRVRRFWRTYTMPWHEVRTVEMRPRAPWGHQGIRIVTSRHEVIDTPVLSAPPGPWRPALHAQQRGGPVSRMLPPHEFEQVMTLLKRRSGGTA